VRSRLCKALYSRRSGASLRVSGVRGRVIQVPPKPQASSRPNAAPTQEGPMWFWWQIWFEWWLTPSRLTHEVITVDFGRKRVIERLAS